MKGSWGEQFLRAKVIFFGSFSTAGNGVVQISAGASADHQGFFEAQGRLNQRLLGSLPLASGFPLWVHMLGG